VQTGPWGSITDVLLAEQWWKQPGEVGRVPQPAPGVPSRALPCKYSDGAGRQGCCVY